MRLFDSIVRIVSTAFVLYLFGPIACHILVADPSKFTQPPSPLMRIIMCLVLLFPAFCVWRIFPVVNVLVDRVYDLIQSFLYPKGKD